MSQHEDPLAGCVQTAHIWLRAIAEHLDTDDRFYALRAMRAWMHTVRDRIGVGSSAHLSAQLPEILRGTYYEGWVPSHVPVHHSASEFVAQFAREAGIEPDKVPQVAGAVTAALEELFSPGMLGRIFSALPMPLRHLLRGAGEIRGGDGDGSAPQAQGRPRSSEASRVGELEERVRVLADAVAVLAGGIERLPIDETDDLRMTAAAQQAHRMLLAEGMLGGTAGQR
ncbi:DUF2267 domain-containing protein [Nocardia lijiangensis]|uniref:DUF2267 domain-containing protein n=1 Tax=Nocardia lijiangensis TaxID=299618 RepID=UPI00082F534C|nr:DUF2267 domain-containing protein [Nocardia lijiangensis]